MSDRFDVSAYLARVGVPAEPVGLDALMRLHRAHTAAIPFENLDIQMGHPILLDAESLQAALVRRRRGGYCFQQNGLFRLALRALGYTPRPREARVHGAAGEALPRTHMVQTLSLEGAEWLVDVGFGANGIAEPLRMDGSESLQDGWTYRVSRDRHLYVLQRARVDGGGWESLYSFVDHDAEDIDYVVGNWYTSTHPNSRFIRTLTAQRMVGSTRHAVRNLAYAVAANGGDWSSRPLERGELVPLLREVFDIDLPEDARFRALDDTPLEHTPAAIDAPGRRASADATASTR